MNAPKTNEFWEICITQLAPVDLVFSKNPKILFTWSSQGWTLMVLHLDLPLTNPPSPPWTPDLPGTCSAPSQCGTQGLECPSLSPIGQFISFSSQVLVLLLLNKAFKVDHSIVVGFSAIAPSLWWAMACLLTTRSALTLS